MSEIATMGTAREAMVAMGGDTILMTTGGQVTLIE